MGVRTLASRQRAVFFDRDGVLNEAIIRDGKPFPPRNESELRIVEGARESLERLAEVIPLLFVVTNQPDVARGTQDKRVVEKLNSRLQAELPVRKFFSCYHDDPDACDCRKPLPGLFLAAEQEFSIDLGSSFMVGDRWRDIDAGAAAGCTTILIDHHYNERKPLNAPDIVVASLQDAVAEILARANASHLTSRTGAQ